ncbi:hypothetical protein EJB05_23413 [Eragrostis curvula]|uniref:Uncharacterized protein n=1 Tax=Eragrostis curvula TaxID=38414 RepID=A0A5J9V6Z3_9POAL|nr:hypothetical protein EJB05_23413 [Eragrostis curvula]
MAAAEGSHRHPSRYVELSKDLDEAPPAADVRPGELKLPVRVPELEVTKCVGCGQLLPPGYQAPADEAWNTGIFGCAEDTESCWTGLLCPCVLFGRNAEAIRGVPWKIPCTCHAVCIEGGIALAVLTVTAAFHSVVAPGVACMIAEGLVCGWMLTATYTGFTSLIEECHFPNELAVAFGIVFEASSRTLHAIIPWSIAVFTGARIVRSIVKGKGALLTRESFQTIVNPPPVQEMSLAENRPSTLSLEDEAPKTEHDNVEAITQ